MAQIEPQWPGVDQEAAAPGRESRGAPAAERPRRGRLGVDWRQIDARTVGKYALGAAAVSAGAVAVGYLATQTLGRRIAVHLLKTAATCAVGHATAIGMNSLSKRAAVMRWRRETQEASPRPPEPSEVPDEVARPAEEAPPPVPPPALDAIGAPLPSAPASDEAPAPGAPAAAAPQEAPAPSRSRRRKKPGSSDQPGTTRRAAARRSPRKRKPPGEPPAD